MPTISRFSGLAISAVLAVSLAACGETKIDSGKAESLIKKAAVNAGVPVKTVSCPDNVKAKKGADFDCELTATDGSKATITVHQTDDNGNITTSAKDVHPQ
jgi:hypothetical protein